MVITRIVLKVNKTVLESIISFNLLMEHMHAFFEQHYLTISVCLISTVIMKLWSCLFTKHKPQLTLTSTKMTPSSRLLKVLDDMIIELNCTMDLESYVPMTLTDTDRIKQLVLIKDAIDQLLMSSDMEDEDPSLYDILSDRTTEILSNTCTFKQLSRISTVKSRDVASKTYNGKAKLIYAVQLDLICDYCKYFNKLPVVAQHELKLNFDTWTDSQEDE